MGVYAAAICIKYYPVHLHVDLDMTTDRLLLCRSMYGLLPQIGSKVKFFAQTNKESTHVKV